MTKKPGTRVFAVLCADEKEVQFLGFGVYVGDEVPPVPMGIVRSLFEATTWEEYDATLVRDGLAVADYPRPTNPKIQLDSGDVVWGAECWWGPEEAYPKYRGSRSDVIVSIEKARKALVEKA